MIFQSSEEIVDARVIISDFGEAFFQDEERKELHTPILLLPPEIFFREHLGPAIDVWTLGCSLYEILGERPLFEGFMPDQDHVIAEMVSTLGHLPKRWWDRWQQRADLSLKMDRGGRTYIAVMRCILDRWLSDCASSGDEERTPRRASSVRRKWRVLRGY
jgi:serine/threonine protein kinase